ncbi:AAA family ATPase [Motilimonas sp. 1_MG-2023]|uniref:AAA family ATPase n=1 Tax=Motilimonas cestriensis TaxID=2742685 RepID=A0ABS8W9C1_9GAMM|nr:MULTISPECIES: AAA family ATPase [Motilimonas]MCE2594161.1 AAA family ATPase [Motilimonas cestriensis]MDO6525781.1 AAA family ATPase [Motilimonas sp. 1_MG-2023]
MLPLKQQLFDAGLTISDLAAEMSFHYPIVHKALHHGILPVKKRMQFIEEVDAFLSRHKLETGSVWSESANPDQTSLQKQQPMYDFDSETTMLTQASLKHFKLFRNPFINDIREAKDVYLSDGNSYVLAAMRDAARNQGILALIGESGAGKSVLRKQLIEDLNHDGDVSIIQPRIIDKTSATAGGLCDAIIADISSDSPKRSMEAKARQVESLLRTASQGGQRHVMIIEEAHDLSVPVLKYLKRFWELEDGFSKLLGIILIGQTELGIKLNEGKFYSLREFIRRCMVEHMDDLSIDIQPYLAHKFKRSGGQWEKIMTTDSFEAIKQRLTRKQGNLSMMYPQIVNNLVSNAMNLAQELDEPLVTADIVKEC